MSNRVGWLLALSLPLVPAVALSDPGSTPEAVWRGDDVNLWGGPSPDGRRLSFVDGPSGALTLRDVVDGRRHPLDRPESAASGEFAYFSVFDRTGDRVAYAWFNEAGFYELRVAALHRSDPRVLFRNPEVPFVQPCAWSHDGERLLVLFFREDNTSQIALIDVDDKRLQVLRSLHWIYPKRMDLSPDGRHLVYDNLSARDSAERDLIVLRTDGSEESTLLAGPSNDLSPVWSYDGGTIWFISDRGGADAIWSVPVTDGKASGAPRQLTGPIPRILLMGATRAGAVYFGRRKGVSRLYWQRWSQGPGASDSVPVAMTERIPESDRLLPVFSPDGKNLAFLAQVGTENQGRGHRNVVLQSIATGASRAVPTRLTFVRSMQFSPDSKLLLLSGSDRRSRSGLFLHDLQTRRTVPIELAGSSDLRGIPGRFGGSRHSVILAVEDQSGGSAIVERQLEGDSEDRRIMPLPRETRLLDADQSPDGRRIALAWTSPGKATGATIAVVGAAGGDARRVLTLPGGELTDLNWAPGGSRLVVGTRGSSGSRLWLVSASGDSMQEIPSPPDRLPGLSFSPDGKQLAYAAGKTTQEVWVLHGADSTKP